MRTTRYFEEQVLRKRPYIKREWCERALDVRARVGKVLTCCDLGGRYDRSQRFPRQGIQGGTAMKSHYYQDTDSLYIELSDKPSSDSQEVKSGIVLDFDADGNLIGIDIDRASKRVDLSRLEAESLPLTSLGLVA